MAVGDPTLYFGRDTKVYIQQGTNIWEIPVLNGYSFSQAPNSSEVTLNEAASSTGDSRRGRAMFNDSLSPAEWSFDTYARPTLVTGTPNRVRFPEEVLWANFVAANAYTAATPAWASAISFASATSTPILFTASNKVALGTFDIFFVLGASKAASANYTASDVTAIYKVTSAVVNEVSCAFDIDAITTLSWSGMGSTLTEVANFDASTAIVLGVASTSNFVRNRLSQVDLDSKSPWSVVKTYYLTLTGGSITLTNNITFLTPELIGRVNTPLGHVTGAKSFGGTLTAYLDEKSPGGTMELFEDFTANLNRINNAFDLTVYVGGKAGTDIPTAPGIAFVIPNAHLTIPTFDNGDVISVSIDFAALPSTIGTSDEMSIVYAA